MRRLCVASGVVLLLVGVAFAIWRYPQAPKLPPRASPHVSFHLAASAPQAGYRAANLEMQPRHIVYVAPSVSLQATDIASIERSDDASGRPLLTIGFTPAGGLRLAELTRAHLHERLAILVDDRVLLAPSIDAEVTGGTLQLSGDFTPQQFDHLAQAISAHE